MSCRAERDICLPFRENTPSASANRFLAALGMTTERLLLVNNVMSSGARHLFAFPQEHAVGKRKEIPRCARNDNGKVAISQRCHVERSETSVCPSARTRHRQSQRDSSLRSE